MSSSMMLPARITAMTLMAQVGLASTNAAPRQENTAGRIQTEPARTGKERLGGKASDPQRVDNCKVPLDQRGSTPRPADCGDATSTPAMRR